MKMLTLHLFVASLPISNHPTYFETMESGVVDLTVSTCVTTSHMSEREPTHAKKQSTLNQQRLIENHVFGDAQSFSDRSLRIADSPSEQIQQYIHVFYKTKHCVLYSLPFSSYPWITTLWFISMDAVPYLYIYNGNYLGSTVLFLKTRLHDDKHLEVS